MIFITLRRTSPSASPLLDFADGVPSILLLMLLLFSIGWLSNGERGGDGNFPATPFLHEITWLGNDHIDIKTDC